MKKLVLVSIALASVVFANSAEDIFKTKCVMCHTDKLNVPKANLIGPSADEVMLHVKEKFSDKNESVKFMKDYIFNPDPKKALCASMDKFGLMPSQKNVLSDDEAKQVLEYMFDTFPREEYAKKETKSREQVSFDKIDTDKDGFVSPKEFREFRAKRNNIDADSFKQDLYFKKIDLNGDGKMDIEEFKKMREEKANKAK